MASFNNNTQVSSFHLHLFFFLLISITQSPLASHGCHDEDRSALLKFKSSLSDPSNRLSSWRQGRQHANCCNWHGIRCSNVSSRVISIDLRNEDLESSIEEDYSSAELDNSLKGKFSASLLKITHLEYLDLAYNDFEESQVPPQFSNLSKLTHLDLSFTNFASSISTQFTNLSSLRFLDLSCASDYLETSCLRTSSTKWFRGLVNLKVLRLGGIELNSSFPIQIANFTSLSILDLSYCTLYGSVPYLPQLKELDVSGNNDLHVNLSNIFKHQWPKLEKLWISATVVNQPIPSSISNNAPLLSSLSAFGCSIQESLPSSFYNLSQLKYLVLSSNSITGFLHPLISNLKSLHHLDLSSNNFQGSIPRSVCENFPLQSLSLDSNNITGTIPSCISKLRNLEFFSVFGNFIEGNVSLFSLIGDNLESFDISYNSKLSLDMSKGNSLYPELSLKHLFLASCNLKGPFPISVCNLTNLEELDVSENGFTGTIPSCFFKLEYLRDIYMSRNKLHGPVPFPPESIHTFDLSRNKFSGEISLKLGRRLSNAYAINLAGNELSGSIPFTLCPTEPGIFTYITHIDLSNNTLSGMIPSNIGYCGELRNLKLANNNLTGKVPDELKSAKYLMFLQLNNNRLDGTPLNIMRDFDELEFLNLANNNFEGSIPTTLSSLKNLRFLSLRSNKFNGSIPVEIVHLKKLQLLDLSLNNLSGSVPTKLGNLSGLIITNYLERMNYGDVQLEVATKGNMMQINELNDYTSAIDLSCNHLNGDIPNEIGLLTLLSSLNLSHNHFSSEIPESIGNLSGLQSLDLSSNNLSGHIPQSLAMIDALGVLNLTSNKLSGKIPRGPHFDTLSVDGSAFSGNELLCGYPTKKLCSGDRNTSTSDANPINEFDEVIQDDAKEKLLLYAMVALGFIVGFWGLFFVLLLNKQKWWFPYWKLVDSVVVRIIDCIQKKH